MTSTTTIEFECVNADGDSVTHELPARFVVCPKCRGTGSHVNPAVDGNGLTREDFDADPDFEESYFRGDYDVTCYECAGRRVVAVVDRKACPPAIFADYEKHLADAAEVDAMQESERRFGA